MQVSQPLACRGHQHADEEKHKSPPCISVQVAKRSPVSSCKDGLNLILSRHVGQPPEHDLHLYHDKFRLSHIYEQGAQRLTLSSTTSSEEM